MLENKLLELMIRKVRNVILAKGWSFTLVSFGVSPRVCGQGESVEIYGCAKNDGFRLGTLYVQVLVANSYSTSNVLFDTNVNLPMGRRQHLRLVDLSPGDEKTFSINYKTSEEEANKHFDIRVKLWNPHKLFGGKWPYIFYDTGWVGGFETIESENDKEAISLFISYSRDSADHIDWVHRLAQELRKFGFSVILDHKDLRPGEQITEFMEQGFQYCDFCLLVCSAAYVQKANNRTASGVGYETIIGSTIFIKSTPEERSRFIPIVVGGSKQISTYLGSALFIDMNDNDWTSHPLKKLIEVIEQRGRK